MGMFDSFYDADGHEWQTKAFDCNLDCWQIGDPFAADSSISFQVYVLGSTGSSLAGTFETFWGLATVRDNVVSAVPDRRDETLFLLDYSGGPAVPPYSPIVTAHPDAEEPTEAGDTGDGAWWCGMSADDPFAEAEPYYCICSNISDDACPEHGDRA